MKLNVKSRGSGGRLRLGLLLATAAAFVLVPVAAASAQTGTIVFAGGGSGWVKGEAPLDGTPPIMCHWNGTEIDVGTPEPGKCTTTLNKFEGIEGLKVFEETDAGSEWVEWEVLEGVGLGCEETTATECGVASFGTPVKIKATFNGAPVPPFNITPPTISGTAKVGKTLVGNPGTWGGSPAPSTFTHQWLRCNGAGEECSAIAGAEGTSYEVTEEDTEHTLRFEETADNGVPPAASATSAQTAVVPKAGGSGEASKTGEVYGEVEQETSLESACSEVFLGFFKAGVEANYEESCTVIATSTGAESALSAADEGATAVGHLVNGTYSLAQLLQVQGTDTEGLGGVSTGFQTVATPSTLLNWAVPVSADTVQVDFKQPIGKHDPLHTGTYSKVITLTLQQTTP